MPPPRTQAIYSIYSKIFKTSIKHYYKTSITPAYSKLR